MNIPGFSAVLKTALLISILLISSGLAHAQKSGAHYWGDADGNGIIEVPDLIALNTVLGNFANDDTVNYNGYPQSRYRQDLDGNGIIEVPDLILLNGWLGSTFDNRPGNPDRLFLNGSSSINLNLGDSVAISAYAISPLSMGSQVRTGFGVIFKIDPSGNCTTAQIKGYDVAGGATRPHIITRSCPGLRIMAMQRSKSTPTDAVWDRPLLLKFTSRLIANPAP